MKIVYGFEMPIGIFDLIPHESKTKIFKKDGSLNHYQITNSENEIKVVIGEVYKEFDYLKLTKTITDDMDAFISKDRIGEIELMKTIEKFLKLWLKASEEYKEMEVGKDYELPEGLEFDWYIVK